jgi:hypothetical protein
MLKYAQIFLNGRTGALSDGRTDGRVDLSIAVTTLPLIIQEDSLTIHKSLKLDLNVEWKLVDQCIDYIGCHELDTILWRKSSNFARSSLMSFEDILIYYYFGGTMRFIFIFK